MSLHPRFSENAPLTLIVRNDGRQSGETVVDFSFLADWLDEDAEPFLKGVANFSRRYSSAAPTYAIRRVIMHWADLHRQNKWGHFKETSVEKFSLQLSELRQSFYVAQTRKGLALTTTTNKWELFVKLIEILARSAILPPVVVGAFMQAPGKQDIVMEREDAIKGIGNIPTPKTFKPESDSYNDELFEPISLNASDVDYLEEYNERLGFAVDAIKKCALKDFDLLKEKREEGNQLIENTGGDFLRRFEGNTSRFRYIDPSNKCRYFSLGGGHPNLLGNILAMVHFEMNGIPKPHRKFSGPDKAHISSSGNSHWMYVAKYGKNKLLPYLGVMSSEAAAVCIILLMIEHPKFNSTSLYRARVEDDDGFSVLLTSANGEQERLTVIKPRAREEKSSVLSELAKEVITKVMEWTAPIRAELRKQGRNKEASQLWVGMSALNYDLLAFSEKAIVGALSANPVWRARGNYQNSTRVFSFVERHPELERWADKMSFKALRVNVGILTYLNTDGDLVATAKAFGHKHIRTTIKNYIPSALQHAVYERQIRRHQNLLITSGLKESEMLKVSDFRTVEELHTFLKSVNSYLFDEKNDTEVVEDSDSAEVNILRANTLAKLVVANDPDALAVAMLYRDSLEGATPGFIDRLDKITGIAPRFWMEFIDALLNPLPLAMGDLNNLVKKALSRKVSLSGRIRLPEVG
ncbi:hypothetical protein ACSC9U_26525 [Pseudomonas solani]|uniref:hypothetical protein n=1 Tax=Pseudomonas solani TaxID=2731552 RepID=UPI003F4AA66D